MILIICLVLCHKKSTDLLRMVYRKAETEAHFTAKMGLQCDVIIC
jgi:hypothetical protein